MYLFSTIFDAILLVTVPTCICKPRFQQFGQILCAMMAILLLMLLIDWTAKHPSDIYFISLAIFYFSVFTTKLYSQSSLLLHGVIAAIILFFLQIFELIFISLFPDLNLFWSLLFSRFTTAVLCLLLIRFSGSLTKLSKWAHLLLLLSYIAAYSFMISLSAETATLWCLFALCMLFILFTITLCGHYRRIKMDAAHLSAENSLLRQKNQSLSSTQTVLSQQAHDYKKHLETIFGLTPEPAAHDYINRLLKTHLSRGGRCRCGNEVIDSIIDGKENEALSKNIRFHYDIRLGAPLKIDPVDIATILNNQLDNALEACTLASDERQIEILIEQRDRFVCFNVKNTVKDNPLSSYGSSYSGRLPSQKGIGHGFGIANIIEAAKKYDGTLSQSCENGYFISTVLVQNPDN